MKASTIKTWIIRILLAITVIIVVTLLMLSLLGGTSDSHRRGLEQAFSDFLKADVRIGELEQFNIMPQLVFKTNDVRGVMRDNKDEFLADRLEIAFSFSDLVTGRSRIENFQLKNLRFSSDSKTDLRVDYAGIEEGEKSLLGIRGDFEKKDFNLSFPLEKADGARPSYSFLPERPLSGNFGRLLIKGRLSENVEISSQGVTVMTGQADIASGSVTFECLPALKNADTVAKNDIDVFKRIPFFHFAESCGQ